jgi:two-component sensor histidine kinase
LPGREAVTYGVLVNELMTNSIKHAFPDDLIGTVTLAVTMPSADEITVEVIDDGVGMPNSEGKGLGTTILTNLAKSLGAEVHIAPVSPGDVRPGLKTSFTARPTRIAMSA